MIVEKGSAIIDGTLRSAEAHSLDVTILDHLEINKRFPTLRETDKTVAVLEKVTVHYFLKLVRNFTRPGRIASRGAKTLFNESIGCIHSIRLGNFND